MRLNELLRYLVSIGEIPNRERALGEFRSLVKAFGYEHYCIFHAPKPVENPEQLLVADNWPAGWVERYIARKYFGNDPLMRYLLRTNRSFSWPEAFRDYEDHPHFSRMQKVIQDAKAHGMSHGHVIPVFGRNGLMGAVTLAGSRQVELAPVELMQLEAAARATYLRLRELDGSAVEARAGDGTDIILTQRELQALSNMADGMTSAEIAENLAVAPSTIDWYRSSVQEKLGAKNRIHAVAIALRRGLIA